MRWPSGSLGFTGDRAGYHTPARTKMTLHYSTSTSISERNFPKRGEYANFVTLWEPCGFYAAPSALLCWKHSLQNTGRPWVGRKGTVVSFPHCEQEVFVSALICPPPPPSARFALQPLHRFGSFLKPLSAKNICSPAVNTNSAPHSAHFSTLSWNSICRFPLALPRSGDAHSLLDRRSKSGYR